MKRAARKEPLRRARRKVRRRLTEHELNIPASARAVEEQMAHLRAVYVHVAGESRGGAWSLRDHVANARMRLDRLAECMALDMPQAGLEVDIARSLLERVEVIVRLCKARQSRPATPPDATDRRTPAVATRHGTSPARNER